MSNRYHTIGKSLKRVDARGKVTGETRFLTDIFIEGMVHAYPVYAEIPFGEITGVDTNRASGRAGFIAAVFAGDIPGDNQVGVIIEDQPLFAGETVRFIGDVIGLVIGESEEAAYSGAGAVEVSYKEYDPILSIGESKNAVDNFIHSSNIACNHRVVKGDIKDGFRQSDVIVESEFSTPYQEHYYFEPQGCIVIPEDNDNYTVLGSLQCPFYVQKAVAKALGIPYSKVKVTQVPTGGAFGGKEDVPSELCARAAVAASVVKRPVKMVYRRRDDVQLTSKRHPFRMYYRVGVSKQGKLLAAEIKLETNASAYATLSPVVSYRSTMQAMGPYVIPHIKVENKSYYTNLPPAGAFRGFGSPQATFGHERMMDIIAERLNIDSVEFRLMNVLKKGDSTQTGQKLISSVGAKETITLAKKSAGWDERRTDGNNDSRYLRGIGIAASHYGNCLGAAGWFMDGAGVRVQIQRDGSIVIAFGLTEMGQGALTAVTQMAAEALGVDPGRISVIPTDTQNVPDSGPSVASRNVVMTGNAIKDAADKLNPILKSAAAELLECGEEEVRIENDRIKDAGSGSELSFTELCGHLFSTNKQMDMIGWWHVPELEFDPETGVGEAYFTYSYATHAAEVLVDRLTGLVKVVKITAAHDVGRVINPAGIEGQVEGGAAQGMGWAVMENFRTSRGKVLSDNLTTYLLPTMMDIPEVETVTVEAAEPNGPWGAKGIGEPAIIPTAAAIANAVSNAIGKPFNKIPITPEDVLRALGE
ncbi:MAG: xanthine dehydrogenase family protein [FCB group bacterium]|nr:xanthine dehydrogenase family protein [FCB group bacterium]